MFRVLDVLGFRRFCFGHILDVLGLDVLGLDVLVLDVLGEHACGYLSRSQSNFNFLLRFGLR